MPTRRFSANEGTVYRDLQSTLKKPRPDGKYAKMRRRSASAVLVTPRGVAHGTEARMQSQYSSALLARFWSKVDKSGPIPEHRPDLGPCWVWTGWTNKAGYGRFDLAWRPSRKVLAHRFSFQLQHGSITAGLDVCHGCDNPPCVRPSHLFSGTRAENLQDMAAKGRQNFQRRPEAIRRGQQHWSQAKPERLPHGERNGLARLTESAVREMRRLWDGGLANQPGLAAQFGVSQTTVSKIVLRKAWRHVDGEAS